MNNQPVANQRIIQVKAAPAEVSPFDNPAVVNSLFSDPHSVNPLLDQPFSNAFGVPGYGGFGARYIFTLADAMEPSVEPASMGTEPREYVASGAVYEPASGKVTLADGTTFYRVPGTRPSASFASYTFGSGGASASQGSSYLSGTPAVISKSALSNIFLPYIW